ncbi:MAG: hypothetical protein P0S94_00600 [Simkaniaceae bacterium]|nr:hypothetical protein [Simkaniaceae bacterium]
MHDALIDHLKRMKKKKIIASSDELLAYFSDVKVVPVKEVKPAVVAKPKVHVKPTPKLPEKTKPVPKKASVELQPAAMPKASDSPMLAYLRKLFPRLVVHETPPDDALAKRIKNQWQDHLTVPDIPILATDSRYLSFLQNIAKAIGIKWKPSRVINANEIEKKSGWDAFLDAPNLTLILMPDEALWKLEGLKKHYKEYPQTNKRYLGKTPLLLLPDLKLYLKDPTLKRSLWTLICQIQSQLSS